MLTRALRLRRLDAALGKIACDLVFRDVRYLDAFRCTWRRGDVGILDGTIVTLESGIRGTRVIEGRGRALVPGFVDAHVHVESSLMVPSEFARSVLPKGTTTAICDPHEIANVLGRPGLEQFFDFADALEPENAPRVIDLRVMLSSCVPATDLETNGGGTLRASDLVPLRKRRKALGLAEMMNVPGVLFGDPLVLEKLEEFADVRIDGHCPLLRGAQLSAYAAMGISSCHESTELAEAEEKLTKGLAVWIREGSVAKDLAALIPLLDAASSPAIGFCTDDRNPLDIATEGHVDHLVRRAIAAGVDTAVAYRSSSWSVARHYGLGTKGAIAPGYDADLVLLDDEKSVALHSVYVAGRPVTEIDIPATLTGRLANTIRTAVPEERDLLGPDGPVHVIIVEPGKILTGRSVERHDAPGVARLAVQERYGKGQKPANGYVRGFGEKFRGAIASSVGHDSHNLIVVGSSASDMRAALAALVSCGGGFVVVQDGKVLAELPLPYAGLMAVRPLEETRRGLVELRAASHAVGCELEEPFLQLAFLSLPVIPSLKLTDRGLVDVDKFAFLPVRAA